jgi:hypothetical protein
MSASPYELEDALDEVRRRISGDLGVQLHKLVDYLGRSLQVVSLFWLVPQNNAVGAGPEAPG